MQYAGIIPEDAPDPRLEMLARLRGAPMLIWGLAPQPSIEGHVDVSTASTTDGTGVAQQSVSLSYPLWRNPADHTDPVNRAALDEDTLTSLDEVPPWPRPDWLVAAAARMKDARLGECVRTTWHRDPGDRATLPIILVEHVRYILVNQFATRLGITPGPHAFDHPALAISPAALNPAVTVSVEGIATPAIEIDTNPFVYAVGFAPATDKIVTAVLPRDELPHLSISFTRWDVGAHL